MLLLGASVRAAAWSAWQTGDLRPFCIDLFADSDLQLNCPTRSIAASAYPGGFLQAARLAPAGPWVYTGALENHPALIDALAKERPLWGNQPASVRAVRLPTRLAEVLHKAGLPCPEVADTAPVHAAKRWLVKPRKSAGGAGLSWWEGQAVSPSCYLQEWIEGISCSAQFVGHADQTAHLLGVTRQLVGISWLNAGGFRYCGNIGPMKLEAGTVERVRKLGDALARVCGLRGFFGVDFILRDGLPWPVEINPRYTAGVEVLERALGEPFFSYHRACFDTATPLPAVPDLREATSFCGKAILFARSAVDFPEDGPWRPSLEHSWSAHDIPDYADIPQPRSTIEKGQPILTLFAKAANEASCLEILREKSQALDRYLLG